MQIVNNAEIKQTHSDLLTQFGAKRNLHLGDTNPGGNPLIALVQSLTANSSFTTYHLATILMSFYLGTPRYEFPTHSLSSIVQTALLLIQPL
ncbi:hypothetical protein QL285_030492 [Trifolium repens]|nr:hypothetical protein QL285_030492 [Trifolium repens]